MKKLITLFIISVFLYPEFSFSIDCSDSTVGFTPINMLGPGLFRGYQGGLYPGGSNVRPTAHNSSGVIIANNIVPLDTAGNPDPINGKVVLLSIGMSNTAIEFTDFMSLVAASSVVNPKLVVVNGAQGGQDINEIINPLDSFWIIVLQKLALKGVTAKQVQAVWYKEAEAGASDTNFVTYSTGLKNKYKTVMNMLKTNYKNVKLCYSTSRIYAGYATTLTNPEPFAYYNGWTVKWMIEDQISGDTTLKFSGATPNSPWLSWGPYVWADGVNPGLDGLKWICPTDYMADGTHPNATGSMKVATRLFTFFSTDATTKPWFLKNITAYLTIGIQALLNQNTSISNTIDTAMVFLRNNTAPFSIVDSAKAAIDSITHKGIFKFYNAPPQPVPYHYHVTQRNSIETWSRPGGEILQPGGIYNYNFTVAANRAYGSNQILVGSLYCFYSGDIIRDGRVDLNDIIKSYNDASNFVSGYVISDLNGDRLVDLSDVVFTYNNSNSFVTKITP